MKLEMVSGLPFIQLTIEHKGQHLLIENVLVDTGSATTVFSTDLLATINIKPEYDDDVHRISGVGGYEYVIQKTIDQIRLDEANLKDYTIQLGDLDYGFAIQGIVGADVLNAVGGIVDFSNKTLSFKV